MSTTWLAYGKIARGMAEMGQKLLRAMCGRLRVGKDFLHERSIGRCSHVLGLLMRFTWPLAIMPSADQVPVKKLAFDNALAQVGCPDRRIDRLCITCCPQHQKRPLSL